MERINVKNIKAILFDLDNTLYDEKQYIYSGFRKVAEYLSTKHGLSSEYLFNILVEDYKKGLRRRNFNVLLEKTGINDEIETLVLIYRTHLPDITPYPEVKQVLEKLREKGYVLGLITDGPPSSQYNKILSLGLRKYFETIIVTDELGIEYRKPNPKPYILSLKILNVNPSQTIFIGDIDEKDLKGAKNVGMYTVLINRDRENNVKPRYADFIINDLWGLLDIIDP